MESEQIGTNKYSIESYSWQTSGYKFDTVYADIELYCSGINNPFNDNYGDQLNHITVSTSNASGGYCAGLGASSVGVNDYDYGYGGTTVTLTYSPN